MDRPNTISQQGTSVLATNKVLRNTYILLALTLIFSSITAAASTLHNAAPVNVWIFIIVAIGFPFLLNAVRNSPWALVLTFAYTGFIGWSLGPILNFYIKTFSNGPSLIMMALGSTGLIFLGLSAFAMNTKRDFSHWGRFLAIGVIVALIAMVVNIFLKMPALQLAISVIFALISGAYIMYMTNQIIQGGERNYVIATVVLYVSLINIFLTILQFLGMFAGDRN